MKSSLYPLSPAPRFAAGSPKEQAGDRDWGERYLGNFSKTLITGELIGPCFPIVESMMFQLPPIPDAERTPLVEALLAIIDAQQQRIQLLEETVQQLRDEIAILKGQKPRPKIAPSQLEKPPPQPPPAAGHKRPGSEKRSKNVSLTITDEVVVPFPGPPDGSVHQRYEEYIVQELVIQAKATRYLRERIQLPDGSTLLAALPESVLDGKHFGPELIAYILYQYHQCHVTQPLLLEQLQEMGIDISAGQISHLLTEDHAEFHQEKAEVLTVGLQVSSYIGVDDTGARHEGKNGYCTAIGNDLFACFESTDSKSRLNFLQVLRGAGTGYAINEVTLAYWERQELSQAVVAKLNEEPRSSPTRRPGRPGWRNWASPRNCMCGSPPKGRCWAADRPGGLGGPGHSQRRGPAVRYVGACRLLGACGTALGTPGALQRDPPRGHRAGTAADLGTVPGPEEVSGAARSGGQARVGGPLRCLGQPADQLSRSIGHVLKEMRAHKADLLRVLDRPEVPLHNNGTESDIRDYVKVRKISGSTRSAAGAAAGTRLPV